LITQEDSVVEAIKKVGLEKLLSIGEIIDKYYGDLTEAFNEEIAETLPEHMTCHRIVRLSKSLMYCDRRSIVAERRRWDSSPHILLLKNTQQG